MVDIVFGEGISQAGELVDMGADKDIIDKAGSWYSYGEDRIGQGRENAKRYLLDNPAIYEEVDKRVRAAYGIGEPLEEDEKKAEAEAKKAAKAEKEAKTAKVEK